MCMKLITGNAISLAQQGEFDVLVHVANCFHVMGAGFAKSLREIYPEVYAVDLKTKKGSRRKLGTISICKPNKELTIVNMYAQFQYGGDTPHLNNDALRDCLREVRSKFKGKRIGMPKIGSGLANGNWEIIKKIIGIELYGENVAIVEYSPF